MVAHSHLVLVGCMVRLEAGILAVEDTLAEKDTLAGEGNMAH